MAHHEFTTPVTEAQVRALRVNDTVTLNGALYGIRDATQIHLFDRGRRTRFDLAGHAVIHTAPNVKKVEKSQRYPAGYAPICVGTTTSARMERFTRPLMREYGVRIVIGKGGLGQESQKAFAELAPRRWKPPGSRRSRTSTWMTSTRNRCGSFACAVSGRSWSPWTASARACLHGSTMSPTNAARRRSPGSA
jgi:L(+)-tartrate dehydratase beta subunit